MGRRRRHLALRTLGAVRMLGLGAACLAFAACAGPGGLVPSRPQRLSIAQLPGLTGARALGIVAPGHVVVVSADEDGGLSLLRVRAPVDDGAGGAGVLEARVPLHDDDRFIAFVIERELLNDRQLTERDLDVAAVQPLADGTVWIGDRRGPFLLHFDARGQLLAPPVALPDLGRTDALTGPDNPLDERNAARSCMRALARHARAHGATQVPTVSSHHALIADGDPDTDMPWRRPPVPTDLFDPRALGAEGFRVVPWTVNEPARMRALLELGVAGIITDRPDLLYAQLQGFDADGDGTPGDFLALDGRVIRSHFDLQGHRGARDLRPENTLPAMEAALDHHATTLELDVAITADEVVLVSHDPIVNPAHCRRADGAASDQGAHDHGVLIHRLTGAQVQSDYVCDRTSRARTQQTNARELSPVAVAFARARGLADPYVMPTLGQVFQFVEFYADYYRTGPGAQAPAAAIRAADAQQVRFNVETKTNPARPEQTAPLETFVRATARAIVDAGMASRSNIQSFDFRGNLLVQAEFPEIATAYLFGDSPAALGYDGANLENPVWRAGLAWPYLSGRAHRVAAGDGITGLSASPDGRYLYALLGRGLVDGPRGIAMVYVLDLQSGDFLPVRHAVPRHDAASSLSGLSVVGATAFAVERGAQAWALGAYPLTSTDPARADPSASVAADAGPPARLPARVHSLWGLWNASETTLWHAAIEDDALVWRRYVRQ